jgi:hypothetical protein
MTKEEILRSFQLLNHGSDGIGAWINEKTPEEVFERLIDVSNRPLSKVQLNQLLSFGHEAPVSDDFYQYYWLTTPEDHPYPVRKLPGFAPAFLQKDNKTIGSIEHLVWGLYRLFVDGLLYFGNVRTAYRKLRSLTSAEIMAFFEQKRTSTSLIKDRGPALPLKTIPMDDRYLISEMACKSYGDSETPGQLKDALINAFQAHRALSEGKVTVRELLTNKLNIEYSGREFEFLFSADDVLDETVESEVDLEQKYDRIAARFNIARNSALQNTRYYLSMVNDLDVYVATSMRNRQDFRKMARTCDQIFADSRLKELQLRYFDPTLSAATGHEDKGLIECLMVKCAKVLVYCAGEKESYGKDAEAAMALSLGKPVIFYCDEKQRSRFYKEVHPLSRLIEFSSGVAVGAMVTDSLDDVSGLLYRIFENQMEYQLDQKKPGYLRLKETLTDSVVRLQTSDRMLAETFWNHYHNRG